MRGLVSTRGAHYELGITNGYSLIYCPEDTHQHVDIIDADTNTLRGYITSKVPPEYADPAKPGETLYMCYLYSADKHICLRKIYTVPVDFPVQGWTEFQAVLGSQDIEEAAEAIWNQLTWYEPFWKDALTYLPDAVKEDRAKVVEQATVAHEGSWDVL